MSKIGPLLLSSFVLACAGQPTDAPPQPASASARVVDLAQTDADFLLFRAEGRIGEEQLRVHADELRSSFVYSDRGNRVPLAATLELGPDGLPRRFAAWGKTSPMTEVDVAIAIADGEAKIREGDATRTLELPPLYFTAAGATPIGVKQALIAAWDAYGRPATLPLLPDGTAAIRKRGDDELELGGARLELERLDLAGFQWGHEVAWIDAQGRLIAIVTNEGTGGQLVGIREGFEGLLEQLIARATVDGIARLAEGGVAPSHAGRYAIVHARVVDGTGAAPLDDAVIVIADGKIEGVGPGPAPADLPTLDARGQTALPGLWDMHAHLEQVEWGPAYLAAGVTTVRDVGNSLTAVESLRAAELSPRILCAGLIDGADGNAIGRLTVRRVADIEPILDRIEAAGCTQIKIYMSVDPSLVGPLSEAAHRRGLGVTGHVPLGMTLDEVVDAGMDVVAHLDGAWLAVLPEGTSGAALLPATLALDPDSPRARSVYAKLVAHGTAIDPTLALAELLLVGPGNEPGVGKLPAGRKPLFESIGPAPGTPPEQLAAQAMVFAQFERIVGALHRAGVTIVAGTDACVPGHSLHRELEIYVEAGMTPLEAIQSASSVPARVMGVAAEVGTLEAGKRADLILVDGDPLSDISALREVTTVVTDGRAYATDPLWKLVGFAGADRRADEDQPRR